MSGRWTLRAAPVLCASILAACSGGGGRGALPAVAPPPPAIPGIGVFDRSVADCIVSYDGFVSYAVPSGSFSPIDVRSSNCGTALGSDPDAVIPQWAIPSGPTNTRFIATSLQQAYSVPGMQSVESAAVASHVPVTWMIGNIAYLSNAALYDSYHATNGDDVEAADDPSLVAAMKSTFPWYTPEVSAEGGGHERNIAQLTSLGETGFWGIAWDSHGIDGDSDRGAPWGTYCADPASYKRPAPGGSCALLSFEWTARDLTRAYLSGHEEYFSTDPDDLQQRAGFSALGAAAYEQSLVDAYAAAGETQAIVMMSQQESAENLNAGDETILQALYTRAVQDRMRVETLAQANQDARALSALPRAVAFPYIPGGTLVPSTVIGGGTLYPATIDYHDTAAGMTFLAGHTLPTRVFEYAQDPQSFYNVSLVQLVAGQTPTLTNVAIANGEIALHFQAPVALRYAVALWTNPSKLGITASGATPAGRAGIVLAFPLQAGPNDITFPCPGCTSSTFPYST